MTPEQHLNAVARDSASFAATAASSPDTKIAFLGGWAVRDLMAHLGGVYSTVIANIAEPGVEFVDPGEAAVAADDASLNAWFAERRSTLLAAFDSAELNASAWSFAGPQTVAWWLRRMVSETAVHRWDVDAGANGITAAVPIDGDVATDGIDEYLAVSLRFSARRPDRVYPTETLHLHRTDGPGEWMLATGADGTVRVTQEHGKGDAAVRGPASELLLWVWGRPASDFEIFGDAEVADAWRALAP